MAAVPTGLGSIGVLLACPGLEQCLHLSPWRSLALTPPPLWLQHKQGKVGPDGKELIPHESPRVGGFGFVATPSPAPGERHVLCGTTGPCPYPGAQGRIGAAPGSQMGPTSDAWCCPVWTRVWKPGLICRKWGTPGPPGLHEGPAGGHARPEGSWGHVHLSGCPLVLPPGVPLSPGVMFPGRGSQASRCAVLTCLSELTRSGAAFWACVGLQAWEGTAV